jgi:hypothetical protein
VQRSRRSSILAVHGCGSPSDGPPSPPVPCLLGGQPLSAVQVSFSPLSLSPPSPSSLSTPVVCVRQEKESKEFSSGKGGRKGSRRSERLSKVSGEEEKEEGVGKRRRTLTCTRTRDTHTTPTHSTPASTANTRTQKLGTPTQTHTQRRSSKGTPPSLCVPYVELECAPPSLTRGGGDPSARGFSPIFSSSVTQPLPQQPFCTNLSLLPCVSYPSAGSLLPQHLPLATISGQPCGLVREL